MSRNRTTTNIPNAPEKDKMEDHSGWKQPIPTDLNNHPNLGFLERSMMREILCLCQNQTYLARFQHANRWHEIELRRGQCIIKVQKIAENLEINHKRVRRSISILSKWYTPLDTRAMSFGLIITVKNYDELTKMETGRGSERKVRGNREESVGRPNKSIKNKKSEKKENKISFFESLAPGEQTLFKKHAREYVGVYTDSGNWKPGWRVRKDDIESIINSWASSKNVDRSKIIQTLREIGGFNERTK